MCRTLQGHGHCVNAMAHNTDYVIRTGTYDTTPIPTPEVQQLATARYKAVVDVAREGRLVSGSDVFILFMWNQWI